MERRKHVLHLSNTFLEGEPARAAKMTDKYSKKFVARSICWKRPGRLCGLVTDMIGSEMPLAELDTWLEWADIIHYHDAYQSQQVLHALGKPPPQKPSVYHWHGQEDYTLEAADPQECTFVRSTHSPKLLDAEYVLPTVVDITEDVFQPTNRRPNKLPMISFTPDSRPRKECVGNTVHVLNAIRRIRLERKGYYQGLEGREEDHRVKLRRAADIAIIGVLNGPYNPTMMQYLASGVTCVGAISEEAWDDIASITGSESLPVMKANRDVLLKMLVTFAEGRLWPHHGKLTREWMEQFWNPEKIVSEFDQLYGDL